MQQVLGLAIVSDQSAACPCAGAGRAEHRAQPLPLPQPAVCLTVATASQGSAGVTGVDGLGSSVSRGVLVAIATAAADQGGDLDHACDLVATFGEVGKVLVALVREERRALAADDRWDATDPRPPAEPPPPLPTRRFPGSAPQ